MTDVIDRLTILTFTDFVRPAPLDIALYSMTNQDTGPLWAGLEPDARARWRWLLWVHRSAQRREREPGCLLVTPRRCGPQVASETAPPTDLWAAAKHRAEADG